MPCSLLFPNLPTSSSSFPQSLFQFPSFSHFNHTSRRSHTNRFQHGKLVLFATHSSASARNSSKPSKTSGIADLINRYGINIVEENENSSIEDDFDQSNDKLRIQSYIDRIRALPTSQRDQICHIFEKDDEFPKISDVNHFLMALVIANEHEIALKLFNNLSSSYSLAPDSSTYSIIIRNYCNKINSIEAKRVLDHMMENGFHPNVETFTAVINSFCRKGKMQKAFEVVEAMSKVGCTPTVRTYNCLMKGLCYVGRIEESYKLLQNIKKCWNHLDIYSYTVVMDGFCKVGRTDEAMEMLNEAIEIGLTPNVVTFNALFNGYCKEGRPLEGIYLLKEMKDRNCMPDYISYSTLLHGLLKWRKIRAALQVYKEMVEMGLEVDERMMNTLLRGLCRRSWKEEDLLNDVYQIFEKMKNDCIAIYPCAYELVIQTYCIGNETRRVYPNLRDMIRIGYVPRMVTLNSVIRALCKEGNIEQGLMVLELAYEGGRIIPSRVCYNILINELSQQDKLYGACAVYGAALKLGVIPA